VFDVKFVLNYMYKITHTRCSSPPAEVNHQRPFSPSESCARRLTSSALAARFYLFILFYLTPMYWPDSNHPLPTTPPLIKRLRLKNYTNPPWEALCTSNNNFVVSRDFIFTITAACLLVRKYPASLCWLRCAFYSGL
jgi:hypothetical protein